MALVISDRVKERTSTAGTGALALSGAATGYRAFSAVCSVNDTCYYAVEAVDSNGLPTGDWETGLGTYSAANTLTRTTVNASSNAGSAVNFSGASKNVWIDITATSIGTYAPLASPVFSGAITSAASTTWKVQWSATANDTVAVSSAGTLSGSNNSTGVKFQLLSVGTGDLRLASDSTVSWNSTANLAGGAIDTILSRSAAGAVRVAGASNAAGESQVAAGNGGFMSCVKSVTESLTIAAAATTVGATSIPAGAILLAVAVRVTTVIPTAATFTVTTTVGGTTLNTAAVSTAANSTDAGTAAGASYRAAATTVTITPNLTPASATGVIRLHYYYVQVTPPTS